MFYYWPSIFILRLGCVRKVGETLINERLKYFLNLEWFRPKENAQIWRFMRAYFSYFHVFVFSVCGMVACTLRHKPQNIFDFKFSAGLLM